MGGDCDMRASGSKPLRYLGIYLAVMLLALLIWPGCDSPGGAEPQPGSCFTWYYTSSADGFGIPCTVYLPIGYDAARAYPLWVELHALGGPPIIDNNPLNPFSAEYKRLANEKGWILIAPWGRNLHSLFVDGADTGEPDLYDDFSGDAASWQASGGTWQVVAGTYRQSDAAPAAKESVRIGSAGRDYAVRMRLRDLTPAWTESVFGVTLRRNTENGDGYRVELVRNPFGGKSVRYVTLSGGVETEMETKPCNWENAFGKDYFELKVSCYEGYMLTTINDTFVNMQHNQFDEVAYGCGRDMPGDLPAGEVSLYSKSGVHEFDEVRIQNEYKYGERDVVDCVRGAMEKYRIDPGRVYVTGHSQGGLGAFVVGLHHPDLCAALRPADGLTDIYYDYKWFEEHYPDNPGIPPYANINDGRMTDYMRMLCGGEPSDAYPQRLSALNGSSARYILENGVNNHWRIVHGTPDFNVPNSRDPVTIYWWAPMYGSWSLAKAPEPYSTATSTYANGRDIADLLQAWSSLGPYSCQYITDPNIGHGFIDPYGDTANFFYGKALTRRPSEVAYKTYDAVNDGAWWLRVAIPRPGLNEPGMARVKADAEHNSAALHVRNLDRMKLDLGWMGLDCGKTITLTLDDDTTPNVFPIVDTKGEVTLELWGGWTSRDGYALSFGGKELVPGEDYTVDGATMVVNGLAVGRGGRTLTIKASGSLPDDLAPNPGVEATGAGGLPAGWTGEVRGGGSASFTWDDLEAHGGGRSLRIRNAFTTSAGASPVWASSPFGVDAGGKYMLSAFCKTRMFRGGNAALGIAWYGTDGGLLRTDWVKAAAGAEYCRNGEWSPMSVKASAPGGSATARIVAGFEMPAAGGSAGSVWFDDFSCTRQ